MKGAAGERFYVALVLMVALVFLLSGTVRVTNGALRATAWLGALTSPVDLGMTRVEQAAADGVGFVTQMFSAESRVKALESENEHLHFELLLAQNQAFQVPELRSLFRIDTAPSLRGRLIGADVIARSPATWFDTVEIDRGTKDGVRVNDPVLAPSGLAGRVIATTYFTSTVLLMADPQSSIGAMDARSRDVGVITGQGNPDQMQFLFFSGSARVRPGDAVMTSGLTALAPKGLPIGHVTSVRLSDNGLVKIATVRPYVDFNGLEYVLVMVTRK